MTVKPVISVNIPVYNAGKYIEQTIESILRQTFQNFEVVVLDDGSTDNSAAIVKGFNDNRIKFFENGQNRGIAYSRNKLLELSKGEYIAILDADDIMTPDRLQEQYDFLTANPEFSFVGSEVEIIDEKGERLDVWKYPYHSNEYSTLLFFRNVFVQSAVMISRSKLAQLNEWYNLDFPPAEDYEFWVRLAKIGETYNLPKVLVKYRVHSQSVSKVKKDVMRSKLDKVIEKLLIPMRIDTKYIELHRAFSGESLIFDFSDFSRYDHYIELLVEANIVQKVFPDAIFKHNAKRAWLNLYGYNFKGRKKFLLKYVFYKAAILIFSWGAKQRLFK